MAEQGSISVLGLTPGQDYIVKVFAVKTLSDGTTIPSVYSAPIQITAPSTSSSGAKLSTTNTSTNTQMSGGSVFAGDFTQDTGSIYFIDSSGIPQQLDSGGTGVVLNANGIGGFNNGTPEFAVDANTGKAYFAGTLTAGSVKIGPGVNPAGNKTGLYINDQNYWYDDGSFSAKSSDIVRAGKNASTAAKPGAVSSIVGTWKNADLLVTFTFDPQSVTSVTNAYAKDFVITLSAGGVNKTFIAPIAKSGSNQSFTLSESDNYHFFGLFQSQFSISISAEDSFGNQGDAAVATSATYASQLSAPTIVVTKLNNAYSVSFTGVYTDVTKASFSQLVVEESLTDPAASANWSVVYAGTSNPANISIASPGTRWVRAKAADFHNLFTSYSSVQVVTPDDPVAIDVSTPAAQTGLTVTAQNLTPAEIASGSGSLNVSWTSPDLSTYSKYGGVVIRYKRSIDSGYTYISVPYSSSAPISSYTIANLIQGVSYNVGIAGFNTATGSKGVWTDTPSPVVVLTSSAPSAPSSPTIYVGTDSANTSAGPLNIRARQYSLKSDGTSQIEKNVNYFEIWAIPEFYTSANDANAQKLGTIVAAYPGATTNYNEGNFTVNKSQSSTGSFKFYSYAVGNDGKRSNPSQLTTSFAIPFISAAYISDLSADKITTGTLAAGKYITVGTSTNAITIKSDSADSGTYIQTGTSGYKNSGFYMDSSGKFSLKDQLYFDGTDLTLAGKLDVKDASTFSGNVQLKYGASLWSGLAANLGQRISLNANGFEAFNSDGTRTTYISSDADGAGNTFYSTAAKLGNWVINSNSITGTGSANSSSKIILDNSSITPSIKVQGPTGAYGVTIQSPSSSSDNVFYAGNGNFIVKADGTVTLTGSITASSYYLDSYNSWSSTSFKAGNSGSYISASATANASIVLFGSATVTSGDRASAYTAGSKIVLDATNNGVNIYGLPVQGNFDVTSWDQYNYFAPLAGTPYYDYSTGTLRIANGTTNTFANGYFRNASPLGAAARQRMLVEDPVTGQTLVGLGVYYGSRTSAPGSGTGSVGDLWVSW
jgi:hypothetical protein